jgi:hypothetical protein
MRRTLEHVIVIAEVKSSTMEWSREFGERMEVDIVDNYAGLVDEILRGVSSHVSNVVEDATYDTCQNANKGQIIVRF